eukprot:SM000047S16915  [mRNA]  locus=s47:718782:720449:+ [translate_table: standard]
MTRPRRSLPLWLLLTTALLHASAALVDSVEVSSEKVVQWSLPMVSNVSIWAGGSVTWIWADELSHSLTRAWFAPACPGCMASLASGPVDSAPDDAVTIFTGPGTKDSLGISLTRSLTFPAQGVYRYYCSNHPDEMVGTVNVLAPAVTKKKESRKVTPRPPPPPPPKLKLHPSLRGKRPVRQP